MCEILRLAFAATCCVLLNIITGHSWMYTPPPPTRKPIIDLSEERHD